MISYAIIWTIAVLVVFGTRFIPEDIQFMLGLVASLTIFVALFIYSAVVMVDDIKKDSKDRGWWS